MSKHIQAVGLQRRREDFALITGNSHYVDDLKPSSGRPPALHMLVMRSLYAHAESHQGPSLVGCPHNSVADAPNSP